MGKIIVCGNVKGGVGKSTLSCNLAVQASSSGKRVLLIDADPQGSSLSFRAVRALDDITAMAITSATLHRDLRNIATAYDLVFVDVGGRDGDVFRSAIMSCDLLLIPVLPSQYDIWAAEDTIRVLREARAFRDLTARFVLNQIVTNSIVAREALEAVAGFSGDATLMKSSLHQYMDFKKSISLGQGVGEFNADGKASREVAELYTELMSIIDPQVSEQPVVEQSADTMAETEVHHD